MTGTDLSNIQSKTYMLPRALTFLKTTSKSAGVRENIGPDLEFDLLDWDMLETVPNIPGVYVIVATDGTTFQYPKGKSPVMYIGMSDHLQQRLMSHANAVNDVANRIDEYSQMNYQCHQRYHYFRVFGAKVYVFTRRGTQSPKEQEAHYIGKFYEKHLSLPVSNGARSFSCK